MVEGFPAKFRSILDLAWNVMSITIWACRTAAEFVNWKLDEPCDFDLDCEIAAWQGQFVKK